MSFQLVWCPKWNTSTETLDFGQIVLKELVLSDSGQAGMTGAGEWLIGVVSFTQESGQALLEVLMFGDSGQTGMTGAGGWKFGNYCCL